MRRGTLPVIPCGNAPLYAGPIYRQAERSPMPELRLVVLALQVARLWSDLRISDEAALWGRDLLVESTSAVVEPERSKTVSVSEIKSAADVSGLLRKR